MFKKRAAATGVIALLLAGCGGGGDDSPVAAAPPAVSSNPPPPAPVATPVAAPIVGQPITTNPVPDTKPIDAQTPAPVPSPGSPPAATPPAPPPEPAPGTYILGSTVKAALTSKNPTSLANCDGYQYYYYYYRQECDTAAYEARDGVPDRTKDSVHVGFSKSPTALTHYAYPNNYNYNSPNPKFPEGTVSFNIVYPGGVFALGKEMTSWSNGSATALFRESGDFVIKDDHKFILNTSAATWYGVEGSPWFVQLQISTFAPSNTVFKICMHEYFPTAGSQTVRRLACTLHNKDTGQYRGTQVLDDSRGLGVTEYLPPND